MEIYYQFMEIYQRERKIQLKNFQKFPELYGTVPSAPRRWNTHTNVKTF